MRKTLIIICMILLFCESGFADVGEVTVAVEQVTEEEYSSEEYEELHSAIDWNSLAASDWLSFKGNILAGLIGIAGVCFTIVFEARKSRKDFEQRIRPELLIHSVPKRLSLCKVENNCCEQTISIPFINVSSNVATSIWMEITLDGVQIANSSFVNRILPNENAECECVLSVPCDWLKNSIVDPMCYEIDITGFGSDYGLDESRVEGIFICKPNIYIFYEDIHARKYCQIYREAFVLFAREKKSEKYFAMLRTAERPTKLLRIKSWDDFHRKHK